MKNPFEFEFCECHDTAFDPDEGCEECRGEYEDGLYDCYKDGQLFKEEE